METCSILGVSSAARGIRLESDTCAIGPWSKSSGSFKAYAGDHTVQYRFLSHPGSTSA
jgi:hypothetical protein